jgi:hypothetical protein
MTVGHNRQQRFEPTPRTCSSLTVAQRLRRWWRDSEPAFEGTLRRAPGSAVEGTATPPICAADGGGEMAPVRAFGRVAA